MIKYETTFILEPGLDETRVNEEVEKVSGWIAELGGQVLDVQRWGPVESRTWLEERFE